MPYTIIPNNPAWQLQSPGIIPPTGLDATFTSADTTNGNAFLASGNDLLIAYNSDSSSHTITFNSAADTYGRYATFTYTIGAGVYSLLNITTASLFTQSGTNEIQFMANSNLVGFLVVMNA